MTTEREAATFVARTLQERGHIGVFVGGCVRDLLMGRKPKDYDVATSAKPDEVESMFAHTIPVGKQFGIIVVVVDGHQIEVATLRGDGQYTDGRRPDSVHFVTNLREDAERRDFTMNAMFMDPVTGEIFDYFGGQADIAAGIIRAVGEPALRIEEDKLRMLRACRFAARYGFEIEPGLRAAIAANARSIHMVSAERIAKELEGILTTDSPLIGLDYMMALGLMHEVFPEIVRMKSKEGEQDAIWHPEGNTWVHTRNVVRGATGNGFVIVLAALLHDIGKPDTQKIWPNGGISNHKHADVGAEIARKIMNRLKLSNEVTDRVYQLVLMHMVMHDGPKMRAATLKRLIERPDFNDLVVLQDADARGCDYVGSKSLKAFYAQKVAEFAALENESQRPGAKPLVDGRVLISLGHKPGPRFKEILEAARDAQDEGVFTDAAAAKAWVESNHPLNQPVG